LTKGEDFFRQETEARTVNGWIALLIVGTLIAFGCSFVYAALSHSDLPPLTGGIGLLALGVFSVCGFFTLQPNQAAVMVFFGSYAGTARNSGFHWVNPFYLKRRLSLRAHNLATPVLRVNDERGNPIEIGAVVVWHVHDTARAAGRGLAATSASVRIAGAKSPAATLRSQRGDAMPARYRPCCRQIAEYCARYPCVCGRHHSGSKKDRAPCLRTEIAQAMLRRQQAEAVIAARRKLVEGAVSIVEMALIDINEKSMATFTSAQKVALVTNLMTVLVGDMQAQPVLQMGRAGD
jgi:hypothetical protein